MASQLTGLVSVLQNMKLPPGVTPIAVNLPPPPELKGGLAPNNWLKKVFKHAGGRVQGPDSMVVYKGHVYTGQPDGWVVHISPQGDIRKLRRMSMASCEKPGAGEDACGRPKGMRVDRSGYLVVADAYNGLIRINPSTGDFEKLVDARKMVVNKKPLGYVSDLVIANDGKIFFVSSSAKWSIRKENNIIFEAENTGRVLVYDPKDKQVQELVTKLTFPTGIELSNDNSYLLISEGTRARIVRAWINPDNTTKRGTMDVFADNLPGIVDNIRRTPRGTFWVGFSQARHSGLPYVLDTYGTNQRVREALIKMVNLNMTFKDPKFGVAVELDGNGTIVRSLQDSNGALYTSVSEVDEEDGLLFIASPKNNFVGVIKLDTLNAPPADQATGEPSGQGQGQSQGQGQGQGSNTGSTAQPKPPIDVSKDPRVVEFLGQVRRNMESMSVSRIKDAVVVLTKEMLVARQQKFYLIGLIKRLREQLVRLQQGQASGGSSVTTATPSSGGSAPATTPASSSADGGSSTSSTGGGGGGGGGGVDGGAGTTTSLPATTPGTTEQSSGTSTGSSSGGDTGRSGTTTQASASDSGTSTASGASSDAGTTQNADSPTTTADASTASPTTASSADDTGTTASSNGDVPAE